MSIPNDKTKWETCEIDLSPYTKFYTIHVDLGGRLGIASPAYHFFANAINAKEHYIAAVSEDFFPGWEHVEDVKIVRRTKSSLAALDSLISKINNNGWESIGNGKFWYSHRFRRRVK